MDYKQALKTCAKIGMAHVTGEALAAMYAELIPLRHGGDAEVYYRHLQRFFPDSAMLAEARRLLNDRAMAWEVLWQSGEKEE